MQPFSFICVMETENEWLSFIQMQGRLSLKGDRFY